MTLAPGNRWPARLGVVGLHLALFALLWQHRPPSLPADHAPRLVTLRLVPLPVRKPPPDTPREPLRTPPRPAAAPPAASLPRPLTDTDTPDATPPVTPPVTAATPPAEPPRTTLRLTLPPGYAASTAAARNPALSDPRSNTARPTFEDRIADAAAATGEWVAERTSDHRTLLRRGDTCVEVLRSRIGDMDRFNENVAPRAVNMVGKPYKCK